MVENPTPVEAIVEEKNEVVGHQVVEETTVKEPQLVVIRNTSLYRIASRQRNMIAGTVIAGHTYPYKGKTQNAEGMFYNIGKGFVYADSSVKIQ